MSSFKFEAGPTNPRQVTAKKVVIDVTKPSTLDQRKEYIAALQQLYGDSAFIKQQLPAAKPPIFKSPPAPRIPDTYQPVDGFRDFVVTGELPQFAFTGSHRLVLLLDGAPVDDISVLSRIDPSTCENCQASIAAGNATVRGVMTLPHAQVVNVLEKNKKNTPDITDDEVIDVLKKHISAQIVTPSGAKLAEASDGLSQTPAPLGHKVLEEARQPVLELHSSRVFMAAPGTHEPRLHEEWVHHGTVLQGEWRSVNQ